MWFGVGAEIMAAFGVIGGFGMEFFCLFLGGLAVSRGFCCCVDCVVVFCVGVVFCCLVF